MPNWCQNGVTLQHEDPTEIARIAKAYKEDKLFSEFFPCPPELLITEDAADPDYQTKRIAREAANREKYGYSDWYEWNVNNWGTKWDIDNGYSEPTAQGRFTISLSFNTAWAPPVRWYEKMSELGFDIKAFYLEEGMGFCGKWTNDGGDEEFTFDGREDLPDIDDDVREFWDLDSICDCRDDEDAVDFRGDDKEQEDAK
jgi:Ferredoxin-like domain in Api92-like protein